jgi:hypothetical protein
MPHAHLHYNPVSLLNGPSSATLDLDPADASSTAICFYLILQCDIWILQSIDALAMDALAMYDSRRLAR